jgi:hypothetical protein
MMTHQRVSWYAIIFATTAFILLSVLIAVGFAEERIYYWEAECGGKPIIYISLDGKVYTPNWQLFMYFENGKAYYADGTLISEKVRPEAPKLSIVPNGR